MEGNTGCYIGSWGPYIGKQRSKVNDHRMDALGKPSEVRARKPQSYFAAGDFITGETDRDQAYFERQQISYREGMNAVVARPHEAIKDAEPVNKVLCDHAYERRESCKLSSWTFSPM